MSLHSLTGDLFPDRTSLTAVDNILPPDSDSPFHLSPPVPLPSLRAPAPARPTTAAPTAPNAPRRFQLRIEELHCISVGWSR